MQQDSMEGLSELGLGLTLGTQLGVAALIALFFIVLASSVRLAQVRLWALAWVCEVCAVAAVLTLTWAFPAMVDQQGPNLAARALLFVFAAAKTAFAFFMVAATRLHLAPGARLLIPPRTLAVVAVLWGLVLALMTPKAVAVLPGVWLLVGGIFLAGTVRVFLMSPRGRSRWLCWLLLGEGLLFLAYVPIMAPTLWGRPPLIAIASYSSLLDAGGDLLLALSILVALESTRLGNLERLNHELEASHQQLRQLVDRDPTTELVNRRGLEAFVHQLEEPAALLFLDLDGFKRVNDLFGHAVGDACLRQVAEVLQACFREQDGIFRWGGDEFLVVAPGLEAAEATERAEEARRRLGSEGSPTAPILSLSIGLAEVAPGDDPAGALEFADAAMYRDKARQERRFPRAAGAGGRG